MADAARQTLHCRRLDSAKIALSDATKGTSRVRRRLVYQALHLERKLDRLLFDALRPPQLTMGIG